MTPKVLFFFLNTALVIQGPLCLYTNFKIICSSFCPCYFEKNYNDFVNCPGLWLGKRNYILENGEERVLERRILWGGWRRSGKEELGDRSSSEGPAWHWLGPNSLLPVLKLDSFWIITEISSEMKWVHHRGCSTQTALRKSGWGSTWNRERMSNPVFSGHRLTGLLFRVDYWGHSRASPHRQRPRRKRVSLISAWTFQ